MKQLCGPILPWLITALTIGVLLQAAAGGEPGTRGTATFEPAKFKDATGNEVEGEVGRLLVPENRSKEDSKLISLAFIRLKSRAEKPGPPMVYLSGGPSAPSTQMAANPQALGSMQLFLAVGDVILLDQRGCGQSRPELQWPRKKPLPDDVFLTREAFVKAMGDVAVEGREYLSSQGVDLTGYTTAESADDVNDLRLALGAEKLNLLGYSYGTHLGLACIRRHGKHLENVVLIGTEGLNHTRKLPSTYDKQMAQIAELVAKDPRVAPHIPDFVEFTRKVLDKLDREPLKVTVMDRGTGKSRELQVGKFGVQLILVADLGDTNDIPVLPKLVHSVDRGDTSILQWFVEKRFAQLGQFSAMFWVMDGSSGATADRWARIESEAKSAVLGNAMNLAFPEVDRAWGTPDLGDEFRAPIVTGVRTLFVSGTLDSNTPPEQSEEIRKTFTNSTHVIVKNAGHEDMLENGDVRRALLGFLRGRDVSGTKIELPTPRFVPMEGFDPAITHPSVPRG
jgi:pimeloyl-ACP methyl ester carboxylesterase